MDAPIEQRESPYEILRRMENAVRLGTIAAVRHSAPARCRVKTGNLTTGWIPWLAQRAGGDQRGAQWWPPVVGEQCLLLAPGGDLLQAVALPGIYSDATPQQSGDYKTYRIDWLGGDSMEHDAEFSMLSITCVGAIKLKVQDSLIEITHDTVRIRAGGTTLVIDKKGVTASHEVYAKGGAVALGQHVHTGVEPGGGTSGGPQ